MKRFSKFFCVVLIVIISELSIGTHRVAWAETIGDQCKDTNTEIKAITANGLLIVDTQKEVLASCEARNYCHCKAIDLIISLYSTLYPNDYQSLINGNPRPTVLTFNRELGSILASFTSSENNELSNFSKAYLAFSAHVPDDASYDKNDNVKILSNAKLTDLRSALAKPLQTAHEQTIVATYKNEDTNTNNGTCDNIVTDNLLFNFGGWFKQFLQLINCGIISLVSKVIEWGTDLMSLFIDPSFWNGISKNPAVVAGFGASVHIVNIVFSVILVVMAIGTILNLKSYRINDLITKFIVVALLINFTLVIAGSVIDLANYLSLYFLNLTQYSSAGGNIASAWVGIFSGVSNRASTGGTIGILLITILIDLLLLIAIAWAFGSIIFSLIKRGFMMMFLLILSPFAVVAYLLPAKGMGQWWEKWKQAFLKNTFYGVYVAAGLYLGTVMLQSLCQNFNASSSGGSEVMSFMSGLMTSFMAAGFLIYIVLLADELAGGSAKAAAEGASKVALGLAAGGLAAGASGIATRIGTSKTVSDLATNLSKGNGLSAALGTRLSSFNKSSQAKAQEDRKAVEAKLANMNPDAYKGKVQTLLEKAGNGERLSRQEQKYLAAGLNVMPSKQRKELSAAAQEAIPGVTDKFFKDGTLSKPEQKQINSTVPVRAAQFKALTDYNKASKSLETETDPEKIKKLEKEKKAAITDNVSDIINTFRYYRASDNNRTDDIVQSTKNLFNILESNEPGGDQALKEAIYRGLITNNPPPSICGMVDEILKTEALDVEDPSHNGESLKTVFIEKLAQQIASNDTPQRTKEMIITEASKEKHGNQFVEALTKQAGMPPAPRRGRGSAAGKNNTDDDESEDNFGNPNEE